jgi:hypothetical protein
MHTFFGACLALASLGLSACSSQQLYGAGQGWQRAECNKVMDSQERSRCMASASTSYEEYRKQSDAAKVRP